MKPDLPDWNCDTLTKRRHMEEWVLCQLDLVHIAAVEESNIAASLDDSAALAHLNRVWLTQGLAARDVVALAKVDPAILAVELLERVHPAMGRKPGSKSDRSTRLRFAAEELHRVRAIWKRHYGRTIRGKDNGPSAADIVLRQMERLGFDVSADELESALKNIPRKA